MPRVVLVLACVVSLFVGAVLIVSQSIAADPPSKETTKAAPADQAKAGKVATKGKRPVDEGPIKFNVRSVKSGNWSDPKTWDAGKVPGEGDRVQVQRGMRVV